MASCPGFLWAWLPELMGPTHSPSLCLQLSVDGLAPVCRLSQKSLLLGQPGGSVG